MSGAWQPPQKPAPRKVTKLDAAGKNWQLLLLLLLMKAAELDAAATQYVAAVAPVLSSSSPSQQGAGLSVVVLMHHACMYAVITNPASLAACRASSSGMFAPSFSLQRQSPTPTHTCQVQIRAHLSLIFACHDLIRVAIAGVFVDIPKLHTCLHSFVFMCVPLFVLWVVLWVQHRSR